MRDLPSPSRLEIRIDEWQVARGNPDAIGVVIDWRQARGDSALAELLAALPPRATFVPMKVVGGRTKLVPAGWKSLRFGGGSPIFEAARLDYEAWAQGQRWAKVPSVGRAPQYLTGMIRRHVPNFDDYTEKQQIDFIVRTQDKIDEIRDSVEALIIHLEYSAPDKHKALPPLKEQLRDIKAAVFMEVIGSRRAGELLGIDLPKSDESRNENQTVRKMADRGRQLLHGYFGEIEWKNKVERIRESHQWWERWESLDDPKEQIYALLAKARGTSSEYERLSAEEDGFNKLLEDWIAAAEQHQYAMETSDRSENRAERDEASRAARRSLDERVSIQERDERFDQAFSVLDKPPDARP